ncbi:MAG: aminoacyl-tRNA hydrolase [Paludibacteraceae bacterium]|nr:aminoacyl-tRNA hydrolase [Paludibacteraceae bacterium]
MKYLLVGLGNIGLEYQDTRHNIGFTVLDALAKASNIFFTEKRYGAVCEIKLKNKTMILLKPSTFMNLSGNAVRYWMKEEKIPIDQVLIIVDDVALPFGVLRLKSKGSDAGHNGLKNIQEILGTDQYPRLKFGIGNNYLKGQQIQYVLGKWTAKEAKDLTPRINIAIEFVRSFVLAGIQITMNQFNNK